jgi:hypothetical protein
MLYELHEEKPSESSPLKRIRQEPGAGELAMEATR